MSEYFAEATQQWNLKALQSDLASAKGKHLTPVEKIHLMGLLCGFSLIEIAEKLGKASTGVETDLSATIYRYVKSLLGKPDEKVSNWRNIAEWLEESGYRATSSNKLNIEDLLPEESTVYVTNVNIERNQLVFMINLRIPTKYSKSDE
jgi:hypothetical protein